MSRKQLYTGPRHTLSHPQLGDLTGRLITPNHSPDFPVVQFRSIPYATIPKRFAPCFPLADIPPKFDHRPHRDFTQFGAACPQAGARNPMWFDAYGGPLEDDLDLEFDEFTCLNLTISVPESQLSTATDRKLPVMVYIHGGGAQEGVGHVDGLHSNAALTSYAASITQPVVTVNIGYRLHWLGNLTCQDILDEFDSAPTSSYGPYNLGMQDQRRALSWIRSFIGGFGGDASNITVFGESAGSVFLTYHICGSATRLFDRAILQSGLVFGDIPFATKEVEYQALLEQFNIEGTTAAERLAALRQVDVDTLAQYPGSHMTPYVGSIPGIKTEDSLFARGAPSALGQMKLVATCEWLGDLVLGDDFWEGIIFGPALKQCSQSAFIDRVKSIFPESEAEALLAAYEMPILEKLDPNRLWTQLTLFYGDMMFSAPYDMLSNALSSHKEGNGRNIYRYSFGLTNPFFGSPISYVTGHHFVEILFVFLTLLDRYPTHRNNWAAHQAQETARRWITFANGQEPWDSYRIPENGQVADAKISICDDLRGWTVRTLEEDEMISKNDTWGPRRYGGWKAFNKAFSSLKAEGDDDARHSDAVNLARLKLLKFAYGPLGLVKVPGPEVGE
ncbi:hypothetical protein G7046_g5167 [Stylonectria norvegica]|nr:hypothetical protein G7046_g5167 [Stylonectria norvegica]